LLHVLLLLINLFALSLDLHTIKADLQYTSKIMNSGTTN
jgi:hypothetical protein